MKRFILLLATIFALVSSARADALITSVQQKLKEQGFYYGEITGQKDADTTAAIRRFQIRNGLQITGELSAETQKSLGLKGA
ncbi:MAG TPA: peptidoglycan-binding domain-containing protein, partial [Chthoniobacterales bacterium]